MSSTNQNSTNSFSSDSTGQTGDSLPVYVRKRDRMAEQVKGLSRRERRRVLDISQTYWAVEQADIHSVDKRSELLGFAKKYGDFSMAYSTAVQPRMSYFEHPSFGGYIAYRRRWGISFALADPVVAEENKKELLEEFCKTQKNATFCQVSQSTATVLNEMGFYVNEMGVDTSLPLDTYDFKGKEKEWLRYADNWCKRRDFEVRECGFDDVAFEDIEAVSEAWRDTRTVKRKEVRFLNRPIVIAVPEPEVRKFYFFDKDNRLLAFVFFDPVYRDGKTIGYVTAFKRRHPDAPQYAEQAIMKVAIDKMKSEGVEVVKLGLSPTAWLEDDQFRYNWMTAKLFRMAFKSKVINHYCYNLIGHAHYKRRFRGDEEKTYFASNSRFNSKRLLALIGLCGIA